MTALFWLAEIDDECEGADEREPCPLPTFWSSSILTPSPQSPVPSSQLPAPNSPGLPGSARLETVAEGMLLRAGKVVIDRESVHWRQLM